MGHFTCCYQPTHRIPSTTKKIIRTSQPKVWECIVDLNLLLPYNKPICAKCTQSLRRRRAKLGQPTTSNEQQQERQQYDAEILSQQNAAPSENEDQPARRDGIQEWPRNAPDMNDHVQQEDGGIEENRDNDPAPNLNDQEQQEESRMEENGVNDPAPNLNDQEQQEESRMEENGVNDPSPNLNDQEQQEDGRIKENEDNAHREDLKRRKGTVKIQRSAARNRTANPYDMVETTYSEAQSDATLHFESADLLLEEDQIPKKRFKHIVPKVVLSDVLSVPATEADCFICGSKKHRPKVRTRVLQPAKLNLWIENRVLIPDGNRCCNSHLDNGIFTEEAKTAILLLARKGVTLTGEQFTKWINNLADEVKSSSALIDFNSTKLRDEDYKLFTGLYKHQFEEMLNTIQAFIYTTKHRTPRQALALFLTHLRLGVSQLVLSTLFGMPLQRTQDTLKMVCKLLTEKFVPRHLGVHHISRKVAREKHLTSFASRLFNMAANKLMFIIDATYLYINKPQNHEDQLATWSIPKKRNLVKPTMIVMSDGYIYEVLGLNGSDAKNSDGSILLRCLQDPKGFVSVLEEQDHIVVDRGYRDTVAALKKRKMEVLMPKLLKPGQEQFTTKEANDTRKITMTRWVVESANGRVKHVFKFFDSQIHNSYMKNNKLRDMFRIACATINAFFPPLYSESEKHEFILDEVQRREKLNNSLKQRVIKGNWNKKNSPVFEKASKENVADFPRITEADLFNITLGSYQAKNAVHYTRRQLSADPEYAVMVHREEKNLIRAKIASRFHSKDPHHLWIKYSPTISGSAGIQEYYCSCKVGARTIGTCSHVASVIWYLGYFRHTGELIKSRGFGDILLDAAERRVEIGAIPVDADEIGETLDPEATLGDTGSLLVPEKSIPDPNLDPVEANKDNTENDDPYRNRRLLRGKVPPTMKKMIVPGNLIDSFLKSAKDKTFEDVETCGLLTGRMNADTCLITDLIIPNQRGTSNTCVMVDEVAVASLQQGNDLLTLGWIHTHPSQTSFLSAIDLHTQYVYQKMIPEAIAIVCAPTYNQNGTFSLTPNGMKEIGDCEKRGFHPHSSTVYQEALHCFTDPSLKATVHDLRDA